MILSGGNLNFELVGKNIKKSFTKDLGRKKSSFDSSDTKVENGGIKPWEISVSGLIPFDKKEALSEIVSAASMLDKNFEPMIFVMADRTASALGIKEVVFDGSIAFSEAENLQAWSFSLKLVEQNSSDAKKEKRELEKAAAANQNREVKLTTVDAAEVDGAIK